VYGAVYVLSHDQMRKLDKREGVQQEIYKRFTLEIGTDSEERLGVAYVRTEDTPSRPPEEDYLGLIVTGLTEHGYSESVVSEVRAAAKEILRGST
jgi:cation transport regulator ChaC